MRYLYSLLLLLFIAPASAQTRYLRALEQSGEGAWQFISLNVNTEEKTVLSQLPDTLAPWSKTSTFDHSLQRYYYIAITPENVRKLVTLNAFSGDIVSVVDCPGVNVISVGKNGYLYGFQYTTSTSAVRINPLSGQFTPLFNIGSYFFGYSTNASVAHPTEPFFFITGTPSTGQGNRIVAYNTAQGGSPVVVNPGSGAFRVLRGHPGDGCFYGLRVVTGTPRRVELYRQHVSRPDSFIVINDSLHVQDVEHSQGALLAATNEFFYYATPAGEAQQLIVFDLANGNIVKQLNPGDSFRCFEATLFAPDYATNRISGTVYFDKNSNGEQDSTEPGLTNELVQIEPGGYILYSGSLGRFSLPVPEGTYTVSIRPSVRYTLSSSPAEYTPSFTGGSNEQTNLDFGLATRTDIEFLEKLSVTISCNTLVIGRTSLQTIIFRNRGITAASGRLIYNGGEFVSIMESIPAPSSTNGNVNEYIITNLMPGETRTITIQLSVPPDPELIGRANTSTVALEVETESGVVFLEEDWCGGIIRGSYDPNDKQVNGAFSADIIPGDTLRYLIRFQNVGNDTAYRVVLRDTLPAELVRETFHMLAASHDYTLYMKGNELVWEFDNILLPDSGTNQEGSNGFVDFEIVSTGELARGHSFANTAAIYFDYNPPVITNEAIASYPLSIHVPDAHPGLAVYPNPANESVTIRLLKKRSGATTVTLRDISGKELLRQPVASVEDQFTLSLQGLSAGAYIVSVGDTDNGEYTTARLLLTR